MGTDRTSVVHANPPTATWQVEQQQPGGAWTGTGILIGGTGSAVTVRLDGFPSTASYRFQRVAGAVATLTPSVSTGGWSLVGQEANANWSSGLNLLASGGRTNAARVPD